MTITDNKPLYPAHEELKAHRESRIGFSLPNCKNQKGWEWTLPDTLCGKVLDEFSFITSKLDAATRALEKIANYADYFITEAGEDDDYILSQLQDFAEQALKLINESGQK